MLGYKGDGMTFGRFILLVVCMAAAMALMVGVPVAAQDSTAPTAQSASPAISSGPSTPASQEAYTLPPDKLAKAIAISRIRNILNLTGSIWGIVFLWILLAARGWSGIERWAQRTSRNRWVH